MPDAQKVNSMFSRIAGKYDLANRALSMGIDCMWRDRLVEEVWIRNPSKVIDLATGSGDVAFALRQELPNRVVVEGSDFCEPMLEQARIKQSRTAPSNMRFTWGDILDLPFASDSADAVTIAFGYRNLADRHQGLLEMKRILTPETGHLFILEFSQPWAVARPFYYFYLKCVLPALAGLLTGDKPAYQYLSDSIESFPTRAGVTSELEDAGFKEVQAIPMTFGSVALHIARA